MALFFRVVEGLLVLVAGTARVAEVLFERPLF